MKNTSKGPSLWLLILLVGFPQISETIYTPSLPQLTKVLQTTDSLMQQTLSIYFAGFALGVLLWGILSDTIGRRGAIMMGVAVYTMGSVACLYSINITFLLLARFIQAIGASCGSVVTQTIIRDLYNDKSRPGVFAKISTALAFSPAIGPIIGGVLANIWGVDAVFMFLVLLGLLIELTAFCKLPETFNPNITQKSRVVTVLLRMICDRNVWILGALIGLINGALFSYYAEAPFMFIGHFNFNEAAYGCIGILVGTGTFGGAWYGKRLDQSNSFVRVIKRGITIMVIGGALFTATMLISMPGIIAIFLSLMSILSIMFGLAVALPHCLSHALIQFKDCLGIAGALLSFYYYIVVGGLTLLMSELHNGSTLILPVFITCISLMMLLLSKALQ